MSDFDMDLYKQWYTAAWKDTLAHLLRWDSAAIDRWFASRSFVLDFEATYHETPVYDVLPELIPQELRNTLSTQDRYKLEFLVQQAFTDGQSEWPGNEGYDWVLAREKIDSVLAQYGYSLP